MTLNQARQINKTHAALAVATFHDWKAFGLPLFDVVELAECVLANLEFNLWSKLKFDLDSFSDF